MACDNEEVGGRYIELGGKFGESLRGGASSTRGEAAQNVGPFHVRNVVGGQPGRMSSQLGLTFGDRRGSIGFSFHRMLGLSAGELPGRATAVGAGAAGRGAVVHTSAQERLGGAAEDFCQKEFALDNQHTDDIDAMSQRISSASQKRHTC
ncbi:hypothetical protein [Streptomyces umbrinus]|uniref:hypothetical protein n=2 Tax=Streptomyces umbrinus TaxID=67370 RepID=UPI003403FD8C